MLKSESWRVIITPKRETKKTIMCELHNKKLSFVIWIKEFKNTFELYKFAAWKLNKPAYFVIKLFPEK